MSQSTQENKKRSERVSHFRLALIDDKSHKQLITLRFTRGALVIGIISLCLLINIIAYCIIAFTPFKVIYSLAQIATFVKYLYANYERLLFVNNKVF